MRVVGLRRERERERERERIPFTMSNAKSNIIDMEVRGQQQRRSDKMPVVMLYAVGHEACEQQ